MRLVLAVVTFLARIALADTPCDKSHVHTAFVHSIKAGRSGGQQLDTLAAALVHDGFTAIVRGNSNKTCSDGEHSMSCPPDHFWLQLAVTDAQLKQLTGEAHPHAATSDPSRDVPLAKAPYRALRPFGTMSIEVACQPPP